MSPSGWVRGAFLGLLSLQATPAMAEAPYPNRPVTLVVPFAAGGNNDVSGRIVARKLGELLGQPVVVENRTGAGGAIGTAAVAASKPDGYTLGFLSSGPLAANVSLTRSLPYDPRRDFTPVARVTTSPSVLVVAPNYPAQSLDAFIARVREKPGAVNYGTAGQGSSPHLAGAMLGSMAQVRMEPVAYRGGLPALNDLVAGQVQTVINPILEVMPLIAAGTVRPLGVTSLSRSALLPDVPAIAERLPGYEVLTWNGVVGPAGLSPEVVATLSETLRKALADPEIASRLNQLGLEVAFSSPAEFARYVDAQITHFAELARIAGVEPN
ncbi:Bug family tripartite tricarboxylate transporter substrate binding protein [Pararoseomonas indoligenes]|uniref:Tripartite tricarboxylate transporter substrate binding protein n=1 Tax=Roseomonas indoligenes TaxID=2820811 RepID=A0A940S621_9PROT|nr:tripartite tricarboxylate transporter substrate binding protein [Pararoseomonas indoligenes]MBP0495041.1 tripartite tricarboxylate transporter substrate binding protein [Pararoseomonas indoligenes]